MIILTLILNMTKKFFYANSEICKHFWVDQGNYAPKNRMFY